MTAETERLLCQVCGSVLEKGYLSYGSGAVWHRKEPRGLGRLFLPAFWSGEPVFGSLLCSPVVSSVPAFRCSSCCSVLILSAQPGRVSAPHRESSPCLTAP
jgi:hypothetical protein